MLKFFLLLAAALPACAQTINWTTQVKNKPFIDVKQYGAKGDGSTDDTTAVQAALVAAAGKTLYFPKSSGSYIITGQLNITSEGATVECESRGVTIYRASGVLFNVTGGTWEIRNCRLQGNRASGNIAIQVGTDFGVRGHAHDLTIELFGGGILSTGGFHNRFSNIWMRNNSEYVAKATGGVSPSFEFITYDTDTGTYAQPTVGGIIVQTEGTYINNCDILRSKYGVLIEPSTRDIDWTFINSSQFDSQGDIGVYIKNDSVYVLRGVWMNFVRAWTTNAGTGAGIVIEGSGTINHVVCRNCSFQNNQKENAKIHAGNIVEFSNTEFIGGNVGAGSVDNVYVNGTGTTRFLECLFGDTVLWAQTHRANLLVDTTAGPVYVRDSVFDSTNATYGIRNLATSPGNVVVSGFNKGLDDQSSTVASASTVVLAPTRYHTITGTTTTNTLNHGSPGRKIILTKTDSGTITFGTSGNIAAGFTLTQNENAICEYAATKWICWK